MRQISKNRREVLRSDIALKEIEELIDHKYIFEMAKELKLELDVDEDSIPSVSSISVTFSLPSSGISQILNIDEETPVRDSPVRKLLKKMPDYVLDFLYRKVRCAKISITDIEEDYRFEQMCEQEEYERMCRTHGGCDNYNLCSDDSHESNPFS